MRQFENRLEGDLIMVKQAADWTNIVKDRLVGAAMMGVDYKYHTCRDVGQLAKRKLFFQAEFESFYSL